MQLSPPPSFIIQHTGAVRGRGVFTQCDVLQDALVEQAPIILIETPLEAINAEVKTIMFSWGVLTNMGNICVIALGYCSLYKHDNPANMCYAADAESQVMKSIAVRDIKAGEEPWLCFRIIAEFRHGMR